MSVLKLAVVSAIICVMILAASGAIIAQEDWDWQYYPDFTGASDISPVGFASFINEPPVTGTATWLRLTIPSSGLQAAAWRSQKVSVNSPGFITRFQFALRLPKYGGGDGLAFAVQNTGDSVPGNSYGPVGGNSVCVRFDNYRNSPLSGDFVEITANTISLVRQPLSDFGITLHDNSIHEAQIECYYDSLTVYVDGICVITNFPVNLTYAGAVDESGNSWVGFCANTSGYSQYHEVINWQFKKSTAPTVNPGDPNEIKDQPDGTSVECSSVVVTASGADGTFFVESSDRSGAIAVKRPGFPRPAVGTMITVTGTIQTATSGERYIAANTITSTGSGHIEPVGMNIENLGGGRKGLQQGIEGSSGLNNMGMLVRTWGSLMYEPSGQTIGSSGGASSFLEVPWRSGVVMDPDWLYVTLTGNVRSSRADINAPLNRVIRARSPREINAFPEQPWEKQFYPDFSNDPAVISRVGSASFVTDTTLDDTRRLRLTDNTASKTGSAWYNQKVSINQGLISKFAFQASCPVGGGADGLAFIVHNNPNGPNTLAGESGVGNGVSVTFDTYLNGPPEVSGNSVEIRAGSSILAAVDLTPFGINLKDEYTHLAEVRVAPMDGGCVFTVKVDGQTVLSDVWVNLSSYNAVDANGQSWIGFGGRTGGVAEKHDIIYWRFRLRADEPSNTPIPWKTIVTGHQTDSERLATADLQRYLGQVTGVVPEIIDADAWQKEPSAAVVIGTPQSNPLLKGLGIEDRDLGEQGFYLANTSKGMTRLVVASGNTPEGATNAIYGLLRELGFGFYLGSESIPTSIPSSLLVSPVVKKPVFAVRGVLPWYNFFNSPTTWDPIDHRTFADLLIRMGANFLGFHTYDHEPFAGYEEDGKIQWGARLLNTSAPTWGTSPLSCNDFGFGTDKCFSDPYFGARTTLDIQDPIQAVKTEQDIMREALDYAKKRGIKTCLGFELFGDPLDPQYRDIFLKRINKLLDQYPSLDYIWLWQAETQGAQGFRASYNLHILPSTLSPDSFLPMYGTARRETFRRIVERTAGAPPFFQNNEEGKIARANEGARLEQFAQLAYHAMSHRENPPKLVISGWGGDERLLSAEYYDGLDKLLPADVVFSSLDHIAPRTRVDTIYRELPPERQRWPIPWLENDGDQWQPQPYVHVYEAMIRDAHYGGSQGFLGIHWRTRDVEETFAYCMAYSWDPSLTAEGFFKDLAKRCYGPAIASEMAQIHTTLDQMGYRWVGGAGQTECGMFGWGPGDAAKAQQLQALRDQAASLLPKAGKGKARLQWLITEMDWVLQYYKAETAAVRAGELLNQARGTSDPNTAKQLAQNALDLMDASDLGTALRTFARRITTRGEYGVFATINTKAVVAWRNLRRDLIQIAGTGTVEGPLSPWQPEPEIVLPRLISSIEEGKELELSPIVFGGTPAWVHYRKAGESNWNTQQLQEGQGWVYNTVIPSSAVVQPGLEFGLSFNQNPELPMAWGPAVVTVMPQMEVNTTPRAVIPYNGTSQLHLTVKQGQVVPVELTWNDLPEANYYKVTRDGQFTVSTAVAMFPDSPSQASGTYVVEAFRDGNVIATSQINYTVPDVPFTEVFALDCFANNMGVVLSWPATKSLYVTSYKISRSTPGGTPVEIGRVEVSRSISHLYRDNPPIGTWTYYVTPTNAVGREAAPVTGTVTYEPRQDIPPVIDLPLTSKPQNSEVVGNVTFSASGAVFNGGYIVVPHQDAMNLRYGMTLTFEFKADSTEGMPLIMTHGFWQIDGWFVQILGGQLMVRTPHTDAVGPLVQTGKWYSVKFVFDGWNLRLKVDGQWLEQEPLLVKDIPATRNLTIGQYESKEPQFAFKGVIRNIRIYDDVLLD